MSPDLAYTLIAALSLFFIGIVVYFHDRKSASNILFFLISLATLFWALANYWSLNVESQEVLFWIRMVLFFAVPHSILLFLFIYNFPQKNFVIKKLILVMILAVMALTMAAAVSPWVFSAIEINQGRVIPIPGPLMSFLAIVIMSSLMAGGILMVKKYREAKENDKVRWRLMLVGVFLSYFLLIITNFLDVIVLRGTYFVIFGPLFMLPAIFGMGYAVMRHQLLNVRAIAAEIFAFVIIAVSLFEVLIAASAEELLVRILFFSLFFIFGVFLIRSVLKEVMQREKLEVLTSELEEANKKLQALDKLKSEFLSFASHQVKSPMIVVKGFASLIYDGSYGPASEKIKETAKKIKDSADRMISLVNNLLDLRKIEEGKMDYHFEKIEVGKLVSDVTGELKSLAENKSLILTFKDESHVAKALIDAEKFRQVIQNLVDNAIKYTKDGWVKIGVRLDDEQKNLIISVSDSGMGIPGKLLPFLFEQFNRGEDAKKSIQGTGLGLYIAKQIVSAHHGKIWAESEGEGKGSVFYVKIPTVTQ